MNLLRCLEAYLALTLIAGLVRRAQPYAELLALAARFPNRWPRLGQALLEELHPARHLPLVRPALLLLTFLLLHSLASHLLWPAAAVSPASLLRPFPLLPWTLSLSALMVWLDVSALRADWSFARKDHEATLAQAEFWLRSPLAPALAAVTLGRFDPRAYVRGEIRKALASQQPAWSRALWRCSWQAGVRLALGLTLWGTWLVQG